MLDLFLFTVYNKFMGKITDIVKQKRNKSRVSVFIDGEFAIGLDELTAVKARLAIGNDITEEKLMHVVFDSEVNSAFERAVNYLSAVPRSRLEIYQYLIGKGYDKRVCSTVMDRLDEYRYTDDRAYAELLVRSKSSKYGKIKLAVELKNKGVSSEIIEEVLSESDDGEYEEENNARTVAEKYVKTHSSCDVLKLKRFLATRGFSWGAIDCAVSKLKASGAFDCGCCDDEYY